MEYLCRNTQMRRGTVPLSIDRKGDHVLWDAIPAWVCDQCGESLFETTEVDTIQAALSGRDRGTVASTNPTRQPPSNAVTTDC